MDEDTLKTESPTENMIFDFFVASLMSQKLQEKCGFFSHFY